MQLFAQKNLGIGSFFGVEKKKKDFKSVVKWMTSAFPVFRGLRSN
jgi:hypothetical protein